MEDEQRPQRGGFGIRVKVIGDELKELQARVAALETENQVLTARIEQIEALVDPEELRFIWENIEDMTEVLSAVRRKTGFPPLIEFRGTRARRRKTEAAG